MTVVPEPMPLRFEAVLFDFHQTLTRVQDTTGWVYAARTRLAQEPDPVADSKFSLFLSDLWGHARTLDPDGRRDFSSSEHRTVAVRTMMELGGIDGELAAALYEELPGAIKPFDEVSSVLQQLRDDDVLLGVVSNIGFDIRPILAAAGILNLFSAVVLSYEVSLVKPDPAIFSYAIESLGVSPHRTLMVGDSWHDDAGGAQLGIPTLILPPTTGSRHGLEVVLRLAGQD